MKAINYIYRFLMLLPAVFALASCQSDEDGSADGPMPSDRTTVSLVIPEMQSASSRAFGDAPDWAKLKLHIMVFDNRGSFIKYISEDSGEISDGRVDTDNNRVYYDVKLPYSTAPRVLHLIASEYDINYRPGREEISLTALELSNGQDAYWNRVELPNGIGNYNEETGVVSPGDEVNLLNGVKLVRNFAKVTVDGSAIGSNYQGFVLINQPTHGTVVPYITEVTTGSHFADYGSASAGTRPSYDELIKTFTGWEPTVKDIVKTSAAEVSSELNNSPKYIYERTYRVNGASFVVIKARHGGQDWYYHIDLVKLDPSSGQSTGYHLLRNFEYKITIEKIDGDGYSTLEAAIDGEASNNVSYSQSTRDLHAISNADGEKIEVSFTQKTHVADGTGTFKFRYLANGSYLTQRNEFVAVVTENDRVLYNGATQIPVGTNLTISATADANGWFTVTYNVKALQYGKALFRVYRNGGLGREIEIISRSPWVFYTEANVTDGTGAIPGRSGMVFNRPTLTSSSPLIYQNENLPYAHLTTGYSRSQKGVLDIFIKVPKSMPKSTFPLVFTFESRSQLIYPNPIGVLTTHVENSGFASGSTDKRMVFRYTLEYDAFLSAGVVDKDGNQTKDIVIVAPFYFNVATSSLQSDKIRVANEYFTPIEVDYTR